MASSQMPDASDWFSPADMQAAARQLGAACGHGALAACLGIRVAQACVYFEELRRRGVSWVNMPQMEAALWKAGARGRVFGRGWPSNGVVLIQWEGPWLAKGVPAAAACAQRHWVAARAGATTFYVWDANLEMWAPIAVWEKFVEAELMPDRATGWHVARAWEVEGKNGGAA